MLFASIVMLAACGADNPPGPVGNEFDVDRSLTSASPCPSFAEESASHTISILEQELFVDGHAASEILIGPEGADRDRGDAPNVMFTTFETWSSFEGNASPPVSYRLWAGEEKLIGTASTSFPFDTETTSTDCTFAWNVTGIRIAQLVTP